MEERDLNPSTDGDTDSAVVDDVDDNPQDGAINVSLEDLGDDMTIALEEAGPSAEEQHRAYAMVRYLRGILPRINHVADAANIHLDLAEYLGPILGDDFGALENGISEAPPRSAGCAGLSQGSPSRRLTQGSEHGARR
jgi:hypothetical protein